MAQAPRVPESKPAIDARFIELPKPPAPPVAEVRPDPPPVKQPIKHAASMKAANAPLKPVQAQASEQPAPDQQQPAAMPVQAATQENAKAAGTPQTSNLPRMASHQSISARAESIGVIEPQHHFDSPATSNYAPPDASIYNEEAIVIIDGTPPSHGTWHQEYSGTCDPIYTWDQSCGMSYFAQPTAPWCFDADPFHPWIIGSCKPDLDLAIAAYKRKDYATAYAIFKRLAEKEYTPAESDLAAMYANGIGVPKDEQQAVFWWRKAAKEGDAKAVYNMALAYSDGKGVIADDKEAVYWYRKAALFGFDFAQYNLALMYASGKGIKKDDQQAAFWYRKSADRGNPDAQYNLGTMYIHGEGVPKDDKQAVYWYCKAIARGSNEAKESLASMYTTDTAKPSYRELTYFCWLLALPKRNGPTAELERTTVEKNLAPEQRARVQAAALLWQSK